MFHHKQRKKNNLIRSKSGNTNTAILKEKNTGHFKGTNIYLKSVKSISTAIFK